jgi:large subunit ribosomal protein L23
VKNPRDVVKRPIISEKSYKLIEQNKYVFSVDPDAVKEEIKDAIEEIFNVKIVKINTINRAGKIKRQGATSGRTTGMKKAVVTLAEGDSIEFFESK